MMEKCKWCGKFIPQFVPDDEEDLYPEEICECKWEPNWDSKWRNKWDKWYDYDFTDQIQWLMQWAEDTHQELKELRALKAEFERFKADMESVVRIARTLAARKDIMRFTDVIEVEEQKRQERERLKQLEEENKRLKKILQEHQISLEEAR